MSKVKISALLIAFLVLPWTFARSSADDRVYELDPNCINAFWLLGRDDPKPAVAKGLPNPNEGRVLLVEPTPFQGVGSIIEGKAQWKARSVGYLTYTKSNTGEITEGRLGLIQNVLDRDSRKVANVVFDPSTGKPVAPPDEVWIVRGKEDSHVALAESWPSSAVFFVDNLSEKGLSQASKNRNLVKQRIQSLTRDNCALVYALPSDEDEVKAMGFAQSTVPSWRKYAQRAAQLGFDAFKEGDIRDLLDYVATNIASGKNVLVWAHSPDGRSLAIPVHGEGGKLEIWPIDAEVIDSAIKDAVAKRNASQVGMLIINGCRMPGFDGLGRTLALAGHPNLAPRAEFANANIEALEAISSRKNGIKTAKGEVARENSNALHILSAFAGNLTVVLLSVILDDDDKKKKPIPEVTPNDGGKSATSMRARPGFELFRSLNPGPTSVTSSSVLDIGYCHQHPSC
jgi:hypothetical protein